MMPDRETTKRMFTHMVNMMEQHDTMTISCGDPMMELLKDVRELLKEQEERKGNYVPCKVKTPTGKWNGEKCSVCGTEYIGSAPLQWKFCPDCGAKMEGR